MRILGIDPGSRITGYGVIDVLRNGRLQYVDSGCIKAPTGELALRLSHIYQQLQDIVTEHRPVIASVEKVFMARNADSALKLGQARGSALCAVSNAGLEVVEYTALQVKKAVVGHGRADKTQVQHMVRILMALPKLPQADAADALACAICFANHAVGHQALKRAAGATGGVT